MQYKEHKKAKAIFKKIAENPENYLIIHYSCESFYDISDGRTPRITSIAVHDFDSAQTDSFSIHKVAEKKNISMDDIESKYDALEKETLTDFFEYVTEHKPQKWIHWNMCDINYGFQAIEHRYEVLGGTATNIDNSKKIDLAHLLIQFYGCKYISHPRMKKLVDYNSITAKDYLSGQDEADAFNKKEYIKLHMSTLRKVKIFANILSSVNQNTLKVEAKWHNIYGASIQGACDYCSSKWWGRILGFVLSTGFGIGLSLIFTSN